MAELETPITTQEALDKIIQERLGREAKKYEGYTSPADLQKVKDGYDAQIKALNDNAAKEAEKYKDFATQLKERDDKIKNYETASVKARIAREYKLPYGAEEYLKGDEETAIKESAEAIKSLFGAQNTSIAPERTHENAADVPNNGVDAALLKMAQNLTAE